MKPFQDDIAKTLSSLAYKIPSYHGKGHNATIKYLYERQELAQDYVDDFLTKRKCEIEADPSLKTGDRITQPVHAIVFVVQPSRPVSSQNLIGVRQ